jgi:hypothetical protein
MSFTEFLLSSGYVYNEEGENDLQECYLKQEEDCIRFVTEGEDDSSWDYVKMSPDFDVLEEKSFTI